MVRTKDWKLIYFMDERVDDKDGALYNLKDDLGEQHNVADKQPEIAAQMINEKGGILGGRMIEIRVADDACQPKAGALAAMKLLSQKDVVASIATYGSSVTQPASDIYEKFKKVNIAYGATVTGLTERGLKYFFRTSKNFDRFIYNCNFKMIPRCVNIKISRKFFTENICVRN